MTSLFEALRIGAITTPNRVVMAPMTRNRASATGVPTDLMSEYYAQRASFGLIISEGVQPAAIGQGYPHTPGLHNDEQTAGWMRVADAVHGAGGHIFLQLMHAGRISHVDVIGTQPVAPSAVTPAGQLFTGSGNKPFDQPREMTADDLIAARHAYVDAAQRAVLAGCDGVELHAANGYLLNQFLADNSNQRTDQYGGSPENRARFVIETVRAVVDAVGGDKVGIRISPNGNFNDMAETQVEETHGALLAGIDSLGLAFLHVGEQPGFAGIKFSRARWSGVLIGNTGYADNDKIASAHALVESGGADAVSFGRLALANPDLPMRIKEGTVMNEPDSQTFYSGGAKGYTDYPTL